MPCKRNLLKNALFAKGRFEQKCCKQNITVRRAGEGERKGKGEYKQAHSAKCVVCGEKYETIRENAKTCSQDCRRKLARLERNRRYKKLIGTNGFDPSVTLEKVYEKCGGICQICKKKLVFTSDAVSDEYPSIDHVKPLSKGGTHTWNNVQLLCRKCNYTKSNK